MADDVSGLARFSHAPAREVTHHLKGRELKERVAELLSLVGLEPRMMERYPAARPTPR